MLLINSPAIRRMLKENLLHLNAEFNGHELLVFLDNLGLKVNKSYINIENIYKLSGYCNDSSIEILNLPGICINKVHIDIAGGQDPNDKMAQSLLEHISNELHLGQIPVKLGDWWCLNHAEDQLWVMFIDTTKVNIILKKHGEIIDNESVSFIDNDEIKEYVIDEGLFANT